MDSIFSAIDFVFQHSIILVALTMAAVITIYFRTNPFKHSPKFMMVRFVNWFVLGMTYAFLYMARYNLSVAKNALGGLMTKEDFGLIFGIGTLTYGLSFLLTGPIVDRYGGKRGMLIAATGSCLANIVMGCVTYYYLQGGRALNLTVAMTVIYSINMFFQSYGGVSIIKVKAYWFHVRERGLFGAIFGTLISIGIYFAFDWGQYIADTVKHVPAATMSPAQNFLRTLLAVDVGTTDAVWYLFFIPAAILVFWVILDAVLLKDSPAHANFGEFDPHDASSDTNEEQDLRIKVLLKKIFTSPILLTIALVDFTSGVLRNGVMQWYFVYAKEVPQIGAEFFKNNWGILLCLTGIAGGFAGGFISDKLFHSRRGPPASILSGIMLVLTVFMALSIGNSPVFFASCAMLVMFAVIGVHSLMSGTAAADFGGRKATATASGIVDGCVYLGSGLQSLCLGYLTTRNWNYWPIFLAPFALAGMILAWRIWHALPEATKRYLRTVEKVEIASFGGAGGMVTVATKTTLITESDA